MHQRWPELQKLHWTYLYWKSHNKTTAYLNFTLKLDDLYLHWLNATTVTRIVKPGSLRPHLKAMAAAWPLDSMPWERKPVESCDYTLPVLSVTTYFAEVSKPMWSRETEGSRVCGWRPCVHELQMGPHPPLTWRTGWAVEASCSLGAKYQPWSWSWKTEELSLCLKK